MARIFISYRRTDSRLVTNRIYDRLVDSFGKADVFKDVDNIPPGRDFRGVLREATAECAVMLVVIGPTWASSADTTGGRRLDNPNDFVRLEVETGLQREGLTVIPVLVEGAAMPTSAELPETMRELVFNNAFVLHDDPLFHRDMDRLIPYLRVLLRPKRRSLPMVGAVTGVLAVISAFLIVGLPLLNSANNPSPTPSPTETSAQVAQAATDTVTFTREPTVSPTQGAANPPPFNATQFEMTITAEYGAILAEGQENNRADKTSLAAALTSIARSWTPTPTPDARRTAEARVTQDAARATALLPTNTALGNTPLVSDRMYEGDLPSFGSVIRNELTTRDGDSWRFLGDAGQRVTVTMESDEFDTYLELWYLGEPVASDDDSGDGTNSRLGYVLPADFDYYIVARSFGFDQTGEYTLIVNIV